MKKLIEELQQYKIFNKTIDIDFVIVLIKLNLKNKTMQQTTVQLIFENWQKLEIADFYEWMLNNEETLLREEKEFIIDAFKEGTKMIDIKDELDAGFNAVMYFYDNFKTESDETK
jgi:hypothetical protein